MFYDNNIDNNNLKVAPSGEPCHGFAGLRPQAGLSTTIDI